MDAPWIGLADGNAMPQLGFGTWQVADADCPRVVGDALRLGYRAIDTAQGYGNEVGVGHAIARSGIPRSELFVTGKLRNGAHARDLALAAFDQTMAGLGLDVLDLFLIHWPVPGQDRYVEAWTTLLELQQQGRIRSIGVSNFDPDQIERLIRETGVAPVLNQIELHPRFQQRDLRGYHKRRDIRLMSWSPLGPGTTSTAWWVQHGRATAGYLLEDPTITGIADRIGRTPAQVIIRWHLEEGLLLAPKSTHPQRIAENFAVFDFRLDAEDLYRIGALDAPDGRIGALPREWNLIF
ncbi:MAG TPA: aldo/keto reductase [Devosia sp.]|jgi:2,5-diketo-D-gluconate reductase A|nr:aldo/keto reductase [Devosia sp.]